MKTYLLLPLILVALVSHLSPNTAQVVISESATCVNDIWTRLSLPPAVESGPGFSSVSLWTGKRGHLLASAWTRFSV